VSEPRPIRDVAPEVPVALAELVHEALAKDPGRRMPTMQALADGLHAVLLEMIAERRAVTCRSSWPSGEPGFAPFSLPPSARSIHPVEERSPLAVTDAIEPGRSAFPPPPPRAGVSSVPPSPGPPAPLSTAPPRAPAEPNRPSAPVPRGSSAVPVVAEAGHEGARMRPLPRRALPAVVAAIVIALAALFWGARRYGGTVVPVPPASAVAPSPVDRLDGGKATGAAGSGASKLYGASPDGGLAPGAPAGSAKSQLTYTGAE
jgi:hypothetical protein